MVITAPLIAKVTALAPGALTTLVCTYCTRNAHNSRLYILYSERSQLSSVHIVPGALTKLVIDTVECEEFDFTMLIFDVL
jgi:hypothetical protein